VQLNPHLIFNGECEAAFGLYEKCLGGKILVMMKYGASPLAEQTSPGWRDKIVHATLVLGEQRLTGGDATPDQYRKPQGFSVLLPVVDVEEAVRVFEALAVGGEVQLALEETFWAQRFGMLVDRFGTPWMVSCGRPV
jgi:PhnB protein